MAGFQAGRHSEAAAAPQPFQRHGRQVLGRTFTVNHLDDVRTPHLRAAAFYATYRGGVVLVLPKHTVHKIDVVIVFRRLLHYFLLFHSIVVPPSDWTLLQQVFSNNFWD